MKRVYIAAAAAALLAALLSPAAAGGGEVVRYTALLYNFDLTSVDEEKGRHTGMLAEVMEVCVCVCVCVCVFVCLNIHTPTLTPQSFNPLRSWPGAST